MAKFLESTVQTMRKLAVHTRNIHPVHCLLTTPCTASSTYSFFLTARPVVFKIN
jgi:hypothetical protein